MSAQEIIAGLSKLTRPELEKVDAHVHQLLCGKRLASSRWWGEALFEVAGTAQGLPNDLANNHDHYLYGTPRR